MIVGTSSFPYANKFNTNFEDAIENAQKDGFSALEVHTVFHNLQSLRKTFKISPNENLYFSVHAKYSENNISSLNPYMRESSLLQIKDDIIFAEAIKSKLVTVHPGEYLPGYEEDSYDLLNQSLKLLLPFALEHHTVLALENMDGTGTKLFSNHSDIRRILDLHPDLRITLDFAHLAMTNQDFLLFLNEFRDRIVHFHISGYFPNKPHISVSLPESHMNYEPYLEIIKNWDKIIVIENDKRNLALQSKTVLETVFN